MKKKSSLILLCMTCLVLGGCDFLSGSSSSSSSSSSSTTTSGTNYAVIGDFTDGGWDPNVEETSKYYIKAGTGTYTIEATFTEKDDPAFRVVEYGTYNNVLTYDNLDSNSTGVASYTDASNNIIVSSGCSYTITFNFATESVLVTGDNESTGGDTGTSYDGQYVLYGSFSGESNEWKESNTNETYLLPYVTSDSSSKYWQRIVTLAPTSQYAWDPAFRIIEFGDYDTTIAGYSNLTVSSNTSVTVSEGDDDNLKLSTSYAGVTLDLTIDLRDSSAYTINIDTHDSSFTECDGYPTTSGDDSGDSGSTGSTETSYDSYYLLSGDFDDASWESTAEPDSKYYLGYNSDGSSTKRWERTITMGTPSWTPGFRVISTEYDPDMAWDEGEGQGGYNWTTIAGYDALDTNNSTSDASEGSDNNICLAVGKTYDVVVDLTGSSAYILVTDYVEGGDTGGNTGDTGDSGSSSSYNYDSQYILYGDFVEGSWATDPTDSSLILQYESGNSNSLYWQKTVTLIGKNTLTYDPKLCICNYGSYDQLYGYDSFTFSTDIASGTFTIYKDESSNNIGIWYQSETNLQVDMTIDMRGNAWTFAINAHDSSFTECDGYPTSSSGDTGSSGSSYGALNISDDYIMGADISSIAEVEAAGGKFYDYNGSSVDCITYLASQGINYARIRLWYDPKDSSGNSYLGGGNDLTTDLAIAARCVAAGMKICLDLHYSDFWAHHGQQWAPKEWASYDASAKISAASTWTTTVLNAFKNAGCEPAMVQVGNETNNNAICGLTSDTDTTNFFTTCCAAVKSFNSNIQVVIHYADDQNVSTYETYYNKLVTVGCQFDVLGLSYYPFWHENGQTTTSFKNTLSSLANYYPSKKVCIMEYSYAFTTEWQSGNNTMDNDFWTTEETYAGLSASVANQEKVIYDINSVAASISTCLGSFYWEPAWLAVSGSAWAGSASASYYQSNGENTTDYKFDKCSWANQALFSYSGVAQDSLKIFNTMWGK